MKAKKPNDISPENLDWYEKLVATNSKVERKGLTNPYTSVNGHMFTHLDPSGSLAIRLPEDESEKFLKKYQTTLAEAYGVVRKEWVRVPASLLRNTGELAKYFELSYRYVAGLKPKASTKKA